MAITQSEIQIRFAPPKTDPDRVAIKARIAAAAEELALLIHELVPGSREESEAITAVEHAVQWAHSGVDRRYVARDERRGLGAPLPDMDRVAARFAAHPNQP
ncbi:Acb2/Tad1 domain-containing protein [Streptomyces syringium]|uniref:Acb2/Tad1 domain-containing protein n=1 Tax=Streptomyces syringium TaxID=76729 RepID=UPI0033EE1204